tara:strand:+ start:60 stop:248 length:189 start_codon:yes stop_codon:yes gene_type:complete
VKVGDLVKNGQGKVGIVTAIGIAADCMTYLESYVLNPDVHVITANGKELWSYKVLEVISESK